MITLRLAELEDLDMLFNWANDPTVRENSHNPKPIEYSQHVSWFRSKLNSDLCIIYIFNNEQNKQIGYVRIEKEIQQNQAIISIAINAYARGQGYSSQMLEIASQKFFKTNPDYTIIAYIMKQNKPSYKAFIKAGYKVLKEEIIQNIPSLVLYKNPNA